MREEERHHNFQEKEFERKIYDEIETFGETTKHYLLMYLLKLSEVLHFLTWKAQKENRKERLSTEQVLLQC